MADRTSHKEEESIAGDAKSPRDPENRDVNTENEARERAYDKTMADSFPTSDPPSSIPDPAEVDEETDERAA